MISGRTPEEKVSILRGYADQYGWDLHSRKAEGTTVVKMTRGVEMVEIRYEENACKEMPVVMYDGQIRRVRNPAAAVRVLANDPSENLSVFANRENSKSGMRRAATVKRVPGQRAMQTANHLQDMSEEDLKAKLLGKTLIWENRTSGKMEEDVVHERNAKSGLYYVRNNQLSFVGNYGFRSVSLGQVVAVR